MTTRSSGTSIGFTNTISKQSPLRTLAFGTATCGGRQAHPIKVSRKKNVRQMRMATAQPMSSRPHRKLSVHRTTAPSAFAPLQTILIRRRHQTAEGIRIVERCKRWGFRAFPSERVCCYLTGIIWHAASIARKAMSFAYHALPSGERNLLSRLSQELLNVVKRGRNAPRASPPPSATQTQYPALGVPRSRGSLVCEPSLATPCSPVPQCSTQFCVFRVFRGQALRSSVPPAQRVV